MDASWRATTTRALPAALELRGEPQMPLQLFFASCSSTPRTQCWKHPLHQGALKEHRLTFDCEKLSPSGLQTKLRTGRAELSFQEQTDGIAPCSLPSAVLTVPLSSH